MPIDKDFKRLVRARMTATGDNYTKARLALLPVRPEPDLDKLVAQLADPAAAGPAAMAPDSVLQRLQAQPPSCLVAALVTGIKSPDWRVRRTCCRLLDDLDFTPESLAALLGALDDPEPRVRRSALHTLTCEHCKPGGSALDLRPLFERMVQDPSRRVREAIANLLSWQRHGPWAEALVAEMAASDPSPKIRQVSQRTLAGWARERAADAERRKLPEPLRRKTERHPMQWVAVQGDRLVAGSWSKAIAWDFRRWTQTGDVTRPSAAGLRWYFVLPDRAGAPR